jgi:hypothetical protein
MANRGMTVWLLDAQSAYNTVNKDYYPLSGLIPYHREPSPYKIFAVVVVI